MAQPPRAQLRSLLTDVFDLAGLRIFARDHYEALVSDIPWGQGLRLAAESFVAALQDRHLVDGKLFERLLEMRPAVRERIEAVQAACRPVMPSLREAEAPEQPPGLGQAEPRTAPQARLEGEGAIAQGEVAAAAGAGGLAIGQVGGDLYLTAPGVVSAPAQATEERPIPVLPPPTRDFAGRTEELEGLRRQVREHGGALIYGVRGLGGIGKTELCLKLVQEIGGAYPDGHVLVELGGASDRPLTAAEAMAAVIRAYEPQARLPEAESELRSLYHQVLKDRRAVVFLDDAGGAEQVEPLVRLQSSCLVLVTSRRRFSLPNLFCLDLYALTPEAARELLLSLAPRLGAEADRIAELLGRLPLALRLAGGAFADRPDLEPEEYVRKLGSRDERVGLVEAAIDFNYDALGAELQRLWSALAVFPGSFDAAGAAAVWDLAVDAAKDVLGGSLYPVSLVEYRNGRYRLHDLARDVAASRLDGEEQRTAARRHAGFYVQMLDEADRLYHEGGERIAEGLALFDTERGNIEAGQVWAAANTDRDRVAAAYCIRYAVGAFYCLDLRLHADDRICWFEAGRSAAVALGDRRREGKALGNLGSACVTVGKVAKAIGYLEKSLGIAREIGNRHGEERALTNLGNAYAKLGEVAKAIGYFEQALVIARKIADRRGEGNALGNLGVAYADMGEVQKAISYFERTLAIHRKIGDRRGQGTALGNLGTTHAVLGDLEKAIGYYEQALVIAREIGDRHGEGDALGKLGNAYAELGEVEKAIGYREQALVIARKIADRRGEGTALGNLGLSYADLGDLEKAIRYFEQALVISREVGDQRGDGVALGNLGNTYSKLGEVEKAIPLLEEALKIGRAIKDPQIVDFASQKREQLRST